MDMRSLIAVVMLFVCFGAFAGGEPVTEVNIKDFKFNPPEITVKVGDRVRWVNIEKRQYHSVWFEEAGDPEPPYIFPGETFERTFDKAGTFNYRCGPHPKMKGMVKVE